MFEEEGFSDIEKAAFERSLSAPSVQGYSFNVSMVFEVCCMVRLIIFCNADVQHSEESGGNSFGNKDFFHTGVNSGIPRPERAATSDNFESSEFRNSFIFDDNNLEKFDNFESSRLKSLIINEDSDMESPLDLIQVVFILSVEVCCVIVNNRRIFRRLRPISLDISPSPLMTHSHRKTLLLAIHLHLEKRLHRRLPSLIKTIQKSKTS